MVFTVSRETDRFRYFQQVGGKDGDHGGFHGDITSFSHSDTQICLCQCCAIVYSVADHRYPGTFLLQLFDKDSFVVRKNARPVMADVCFSGYSLCCTDIISGQHVNGQPHFFHLPDGLQ